MSDVRLDVLQGLVQRTLDEQGAIREENNEMRSLLLALVDQTRRVGRRMASMERRLADVERRVGEVVSDVELMVKSELMGHMGIFEQRARTATTNSPCASRPWKRACPIDRPASPRPGENRRSGLG